jgi:GAF domain-containing protein
VTQSRLEAMYAFAELGRMDMASMELADVLARVADLAKQTIAGAAEASVTLVDAGRGSTGAYTGPRALRLDETQYGPSGGPCTAAAEAGAVFVIDDMETEGRWPHFTQRAIEQAVYSTASVGMPMRQTVNSALNLYGDTRLAFDHESVAIAQRFSAYAAVALANAHLYRSTAELAGQLQAAIATVDHTTRS